MRSHRERSRDDDPPRIRPRASGVGGGEKRETQPNHEVELKRAPRVPTKPARLERFVVRSKRRLARSERADAWGFIRLGGGRKRGKFPRHIERKLVVSQQSFFVMPPRALRWRRKLDAADIVQRQHHAKIVADHDDLAWESGYTNGYWENRSGGPGP